MSKHEKSKSKDAESEDKSRAVAHAPSSALPAHLQQKVAADAGKGVSTASEDNVVPIITVLGSNSPQVKKSNPDYLDGAQNGDIWLHNAPTPVIKGDTGILFQPCYFFKEWIEWGPKLGDGLKGRHQERPEDTVETPDPENPEKKRWTRTAKGYEGNVVVETREHVGIYYPEDGSSPLPFMVPMKSTNHTVSRNWMFLMNSKRVGNDPAPSFACLYRLTTKEKTKGAYSWDMWSVADAGWVQTEEQYDAGRKLHDDFAAGLMRTDIEPEAESKSAAGTAEEAAQQQM